MRIKGAREHKKFKEGKQLTKKEAILAACFECNGGEHVPCQPIRPRRFYVTEF
ncbi:hypothetical protein METP3_00466 [Methanosarcinales archaeon]|nr:hypothetical protein METP3_00466 [Methanosarcinales archaeon]